MLQELVSSLAPLEETNLLRQQLNTLKDYLRENHPELYLKTFGKQTEGVEPKNSLETIKKIKKTQVR